jgi:hypothetical protein
LKIIFEKGITHEDIIVTLNTLIAHFPQIAKENDFSLLKVQDFPQTFFAPHHHFSTDLLKQKIQIWKNWK